VTIKPRKFADRSLAIDDNFLARKVPDLQRDNNLPQAAEFVQGYLAINGDLRRQNEVRIREITATSAREPQWDGVFRRQSNAAPLSAFADRRSYTYNGQVIDHQTHLGYDLASLKASPVEAAQAGTVVFADNLGIYGNTVILDHGLGIFSLYGHLSALAVRSGERVKAGQSLGQTGETGLAGGDHLHFSIMLHGVHVDPVEWWDAHWLRDHVTPKLAMFPRPGGTTPEPTAATEPVKHEQGDARPTARAR
jgi:murein DD-endopeptidase MepM/ murein hydrolase activator NlpD